MGLVLLKKGSQCFTGSVFIPFDLLHCVIIAQFLLPIAASKKVILTVNFKRCLIQSRSFWQRRQPVFPLFIGFVYSVIVVFCRCLCTRLSSLC